MEATQRRESSNPRPLRQSVVFSLGTEGSAVRESPGLVSPAGGFRVGTTIEADIGAGVARFLVRRLEMTEESRPDGAIARRWHLWLDSAGAVETGEPSASPSSGEAIPLGEDSLRAALRRYAAEDREDADFDSETETVTWRDGSTLVSASLTRVRSAMAAILGELARGPGIYAVVSLEARENVRRASREESAPVSDAT